MRILLIILAVSFIAGCTPVEVEIGAEDKKIKDNFVLKAPKEKILNVQEVDWIEEVKDKDGKLTGEVINKGKIKQYDYITDEKVKGKFIWHGDYSNAKIIAENGNQKTVEFYSGDHFYKDDKEDVYRIKHKETTTIEAFDLQMEEILGASGDPVYSGAGDGIVYKNDNADWDTSHDATTGADADPTGINAFCMAGLNGPIIELFRLFLPFNTSGIPSGSTIDSAILSVYHRYDGGSDLDAGVVETSQADETTLAVADFNNCGAVDSPTEGAPRVTSWSDTTYANWTLDATGRGWVKTSGDVSTCGSNTGWTCLGIRLEKDLDDVDPLTVRNYHSFRMSEYTGTTEDPYLTVVYTEVIPVVDIFPREGIILID